MAMHERRRHQLEMVNALVRLSQGDDDGDEWDYPLTQEYDADDDVPPPPPRMPLFYTITVHRARGFVLYYAGSGDYDVD